MNSRRLLKVALGVSALVAGRIVSAFRMHDRAARARLASVQRTLARTSLGDVEYADVGSGEPVLVIHGIFGGRDQGLVNCADVLTNRRVIAPSRFGYLGSSIPPDATPALQADAYAELLDHLGIESVDVIGYSAGSTSAIQFALRYPNRVRYLVIMAGDLPGPTAVAPPAIVKLVYPSDAIMWLATVLARPQLMRFIGGLPKDAEPRAEQRKVLLQWVDSIFPVRERSRGVLFDGFVSNPAVNTYPLEQIAVPTLFVHARDDTLASFSAAETAATRVPQAQMLALDHGGHLMYGQNETVRRVLADFLTQLEATRRSA
jgi:pimeloyl-ACP methyl ester carboxylesterase